MAAMAERKSLLVRIDGDILNALKKWADDDLRSLNGQMEYLLRKALRDCGRLKPNGQDGNEVPRPLK